MKTTMLLSTFLARWNRFDFFVSMSALLHLVVTTLVNDMVRDRINGMVRERETLSSFRKPGQI